MIPARRDGMLTKIPLIIQILMSVYMIQPLIPPRRDRGNPDGILARRDEVFIWEFFIPPGWETRLGGMKTSRPA